MAGNKSLRLNLEKHKLMHLYKKQQHNMHT